MCLPFVFWTLGAGQLPETPPAVAKHLLPDFPAGPFRTHAGQSHSHPHGAGRPRGVTVHRAEMVLLSTRQYALEGLQWYLSIEVVLLEDAEFWTEWHPFLVIKIPAEYI